MPGHLGRLAGPRANDQAGILPDRELHRIAVLVDQANLVAMHGPQFLTQPASGDVPGPAVVVQVRLAVQGIADAEAHAGTFSV